MNCNEACRCILRQAKARSKLPFFQARFATSVKQEKLFSEKLHYVILGLKNTKNRRSLFRINYATPSWDRHAQPKLKCRPRTVRETRLRTSTREQYHSKSKRFKMTLQITSGLYARPSIRVVAKNTRARYLHTYIHLMRLLTLSDKGGASTPPSSTHLSLRSKGCWCRTNICFAPISCSSCCCWTW